MTRAETVCICHWLQQASTSSSVVTEALRLALQANREERNELLAAALGMAMQGQMCFDQAAGYLAELCDLQKSNGG